MFKNRHDNIVMYKAIIIKIYTFLYKDFWLNAWISKSENNICVLVSVLSILLLSIRWLLDHKRCCVPKELFNKISMKINRVETNVHLVNVICNDVNFAV